ncbi:hypothetical protein Tco_0295060 [Tanacetum coccineum]
MITELHYKADSSDWTDILSYLCREAADEDRRIATKLNRLHEEILIICEKRRNLTDELRSIRGIVVVGKATEFVTDTLRKDNAQVAQLREVESQMEFRALEKELFVQKLVGNWYKICSDLEESGVKAVVTVCFLAISGNDGRLNKDVPNLMKLQILEREFELRAREKDLFIEKLKDVIGYELACSFCFGRFFLFFIDSVAGADVDDGVPFCSVEDLLHWLHDAYFQALFLLTLVIIALHVKRVPCKGDVQLLINAAVILKFSDVFFPNLEACGVLM